MIPAVEDTRTEINCSTATAVLQYIADKYGGETLDKVLESSLMPESYLMDQSNWVSFDCFNRLLDAMVEHTGDPDSPYESGLYAGTSGAWGWAQVFGKHLLTVQHIYRMAVRHIGWYAKIADAKITKMRPGRATIEFRYHEGYQQTRNNCDNVRGHYAMVPVWLGRPAAEVTHTECIVDGAAACVYEITWHEQLGLRWGYAGCCLGMVFALALTSFEAVPWANSVGLFVVLAVAGFALGHIQDLHRSLAATRRQNEDEAQALNDSREKIEALNIDLQRRVEQRTAELSEANTDLKQAYQDLEESQEKALEAQRRATIGTLAAGMAHEMNSPINAIRLSVQALIEDAGSGSPMLPLLENAERATTRCRRIVNELLLFSREAKRVSHVTLAEILAASVELFQKESSGGVCITQEIAPGLPKLELDRAQIQQAVLNVLANSADAMGDKGKIEASLGWDDDSLVLRIADDGPGMSESVRQRVFDPFFSTKATGKGTGLGLSITHQLVHRNGGTIEVSSREGEGTSFAIRFPVPAEDADAGTHK